MSIWNINGRVRKLGEEAEALVSPSFSRIERIAQINQEKVLEAFRTHRVSDTMFAGTTGYGYGDTGREALEAAYAFAFGAEAALVRIGMVNGTHALSCAMRGALSPGDTLLSVTGQPYETLMPTIRGPGHGNLESIGVSYEQLELLEDGLPDLAAIAKAAANPAVSLVFMQRACGYFKRPALSCAQIQQISDLVKFVNPAAHIMVDNCYGEFCETIEPTAAGADLIAGSLIKNPGGGLAPTGGYIAGKKEMVEQAAAHLTAPGIAGECGATLAQNRLLFQGFFMAPHTVLQALKTAIFCAALMEGLGYAVCPRPLEERFDINQAICFGEPEPLLAFCRGIQAGAPVDAFVTPEPWPMPGYSVPVVMAAGSFVQGASIELSADAPMREPYHCFMQGGLTYESGKAGVLLATQSILNLKES